MLKRCSQHLVAFGGHKKAAGLEIHEKNITQFKKHINALIGEHIISEDLIPVLDIDACIRFDQISTAAADLFESFKPFGEENPAPLYATTGVTKKTKAVRVRNSYTLWIQDGTAVLEGIVYDKSILEILSTAQTFDIVYMIEKNSYHNSPRLIIKDTRVPLNTAHP